MAKKVTKVTILHNFRTYKCGQLFLLFLIFTTNRFETIESIKTITKGICQRGWRENSNRLNRSTLCTVVVRITRLRRSPLFFGGGGLLVLHVSLIKPNYYDWFKSWLQGNSFEQPLIVPFHSVAGHIKVYYVSSQTLHQMYVWCFKSKAVQGPSQYWEKGEEKGGEWCV